MPEESKEAKDVLSGKKHDKKKKKRVHKMHVRRAANKGYIAEHHFAPEEDEQGSPIPAGEPEEHVLPNLAMMQQHFGEHMPEEQEESEENQQVA